MTPVVQNDVRTPLPPIMAEPNERWDSGSKSIVATSTGWWSVATDQGLLRHRTTSGVTSTVEVGSEPTALVEANGRLFVTLRGERAIAVVDPLGVAPMQLIDVGAEPTAIVATSDGTRVYVASSMSDTVAEIDVASLATIGQFPSTEPRFLAINSEGTDLYVASGRGEANVIRWNLETSTASSVEMPQTQREHFTPNAFDIVDLVPRVTGDMSVKSDGTLLVPVLYADTSSPIVDLSELSDLEIEPETPEPGFPGEEGSEDGYGSSGGAVGRLNPAIVEVRGSESRALWVSVSEDEAIPGEASTGALAKTYITSVAPRADGTYVLTMEASSVIALLDPDSPSFDQGFTFFNVPESMGFEPVSIAVTAGTGTPRSFDIDADGSIRWVDGLRAHTGTFDIDQLNGRLSIHAEIGMNHGEFLPYTVDDLAVQTLPANIANGRALFYDAALPAMGGGGVSCSTCHFEGRNDGMTFQFESGRRQTPSLAGQVSQTAPVTWSGSVVSVSMEADLTTRGRMGGEGLDATQLADVAAFVDWSRIPDVGADLQDPVLVAQGQALFESPTHQCSTCHSGARQTSNGTFDIRGSIVNTPSLSGIAATSPYMHDGSAATLRDVLEQSRDGQMGNTAILSGEEIDAMVAYLKTL